MTKQNINDTNIDFAQIIKELKTMRYELTEILSILSAIENDEDN